MSMQKACFYGFFYFLFTATIPAVAQQPVFKTFSFNEGLNTYGIYKTQQDQHGFIWIATQDGIYRFNGNSFQVFKGGNINGVSLTGNFFLDFSLNKSNKLFAADFNNGIDVIDLSTLAVEDLKLQPGTPAPDQLPNLWLQRIYADNNNTLWVGGNNYLAYKKENESRYTVLSDLPGFKENLNILFIKPLIADHIAVGISGYGILLINTRTFGMSRLGLQPGAVENDMDIEIKDIVVDRDTLFAITNNRIIKGRFKKEGWQYIAEYPYKGFSALVVNCMVRDETKGFWIGTNSGLVNLDIYSGRYNLYQTSLSKRRWLQDNTINHLFIDRENNLWISTSKALQMVSLTTNGFRYFSGDDNKSDHMDHVYSLVPKNETEIFATATDGFYATNIISGITKKIEGSSALGVVHYLEKVEEDLWIVSCDLGMMGYIPSKSIISQDVLLKRYPEWSPYKKNYFNTAVKTGGISYWANEEQEGLFKWDMQKHQLTQFKAGTSTSRGLAENHIHNIKIDKEGYLWLLTDNTIEKFDTKIDSVIEIIRDIRKETGSPPGIFFDMYDDGERCWFGNFGGGVSGYNKKTKTWTRITENDGLSNNSVYGILPETDSIIWVSTNRGLSRINHYTKTCANYYYEDGLQDNSFDEKGSLQVGKKLYFGGINGFTEIDLDRFKNISTAFPVYIYKLEYYGNTEKKIITDLKWDKLSLPPGTNTIILYLAALTYSNNHKIKFSYKIDGLQNEFIEITDNNIITLNALSFGNYNISIRYRKEDGSYVENALKLQLKILPKWYQTWWFKLLLLLTAGSIIYAFYRYRIIQIKKQHEIRKNIATDLHDDLGSTLNSVKVFTNLAISGVKQEESLQQIKDNLNEATMGLRDMIWVLDDSLDTVDELVTRLKQYAIPVASASSIETVIKADSEVNNRQLIKEEKRNLFLICKEAINNSIKYSGASQIDVTITASGKKIQILITDNGKGFNVDEVKKGYGLKNMQYRAGQIKYRVVVESSSGNGTQITIQPS